MTTSLAQLTANRRNAQKSTGPNTHSGRQRVRLNALKHGLTAETILLPGEDPAVLHHLRTLLFEEFQPETPVAIELVERLTGLLWRIRRIGAFESHLIAWMNNKQIARNGHEDDDVDHVLQTHPLQNKANLEGATIEELLDRDFLAKLGRYEAHLACQIRTLACDLASQSRRSE